MSMVCGNSLLFSQTTTTAFDIEKEFYSATSKYESGKIEEAKDIFQRIEKTANHNQSYFIQTLYYLSEIYFELGNNRQTEEYLLKTKQYLDNDQPIYAQIMANLGTLYLNLADFNNAERCFLEAKDYYENHLSDSYVYAELLISMCYLYNEFGNYNKLSGFTNEVEGAISFIQPENTQKYAKLLLQAGEAISLRGNFFFGGYAANWKNMSFWRANSYFDEAVELFKNHLGRNNIDYCRALIMYANMQSRRAEFDEAVSKIEEAIQILEKLKLTNNNLYLYALKILYDINIRNNDFREAHKINEKLCELQTSLIIQNFSFLSERQRILYWNNLQNEFATNYAFAKSTSAYNNTLFSKGLLMQTNIHLRNSIFASDNKELIKNYERLDSINAEIVKFEKSGNSSTIILQKFENEKDSLDKLITRTSHVYDLLKREFSSTWQNVQQKLDIDDVAIEFIQFNPFFEEFEKDSMRSFHDAIIDYKKVYYVALVLRPGMEAPAWIPLCEEKDLQTYFDKAKGALNDNQKTNRLYSIFGAELYNLIWQPLETELNDVKTVYYSPSGLLHKVSFDAIPVDGSSRLFDRYEMKLVSSTREIKRLKEEKAEIRSNSTVLYGGIIYDTDSVSLKNEAARYPQSQQNIAFTVRGTAGAMEPWKKLEGSQREMEQIAELLNKHQIEHKTFTGISGNEESFKNLSGKHTNQIVISTHGFFLEDIQKDNNADLIRRLGGGIQMPFENPLLRSGLVMAGGNRVWTGQPPIEGIEDGILTADEISKLNLINTSLVVLSACQTGLGEVQNSEGVFGLQRAFKLAGVESLIMSLWEVDDKATQIMMSAFYENWLGGKTKQEAFRIARKAVREYTGFDYSSPYYWAAFVMMD